MTKNETTASNSIPRSQAPTAEPMEREFQAPNVENQLPDMPHNALHTVARGEGRMRQQRDQLNVRLPKMLKRLAVSRAALEGVTVGELIERLLTDYLNDRSE